MLFFVICILNRYITATSIHLKYCLKAITKHSTVNRGHQKTPATRDDNVGSDFFKTTTIRDYCIQQCIIDNMVPGSSMTTIK